jgi:bifunctional non-homologous end joining protein LigD
MARQKYEITNPDKVMFPAVGYTKGQVIEYYRAVAPYILPHLKNRPLTLKLYPNGVTGKHIYLKDAPSHTPDWVKTFAVERKDKLRRDRHINFVLVNNLETLLWAANLSSLEMHVFLAKAPRIDRSTSVVFDLDPGPPAGVLECAEVAFRLKEVLADMKLECFVKASGSKGLQVYVPLNTATTYEATEPFAHGIARQLEREQPNLVVSEMAKSLRAGKVFIDWSQNVYYKTTVCVYSLRAKSDRPYISLPFTWKELRAALKMGDSEKLYLSPERAPKRLARVGDLFAPVLTLKQKLPAKRPISSRPPTRPSAGPKRKADSRLLREVSALPAQPAGYIEPMQPEVVSKLPSGPGWQYEVKWDGYRAVAVKEGEQVILYSRNRNDLTKRYRSVVSQLNELPCNQAVLDGEIVALDDKGQPSFQMLQNYAAKRGTTILFVAFDLLNLDGRSLLSLPLAKRQDLLRRLTAPAAIQMSEPLDADLETVLKVVEQQGLEGVVAKNRTSKYQPGLRGKTWFKQRLGLGQEFVLGGYTEGNPFTSLLVGYYDGRKLIYAGKVKAGFVPHVRRELMAKMSPLVIGDCPFHELPVGKRSRWGEGLTAEDLAKCTWVKPRLVVQVSFVEWTAGGSLRHAKFLGERIDKKPTQVQRET